MAKKYAPNATISVSSLIRKFPDADTARRHLEKVLWAGKPACPFCENTDKITTRKRTGFYRCNLCKRDFTVRTNTIFEKSKIPLDKWIIAIYLVVSKGIPSLQLSKEIGITQKSAWFMFHRIKEACQDNKARLSGIFEADETYKGDKEKTEHTRLGSVEKKAALGMYEHGAVKHNVAESVMRHGTRRRLPYKKLVQ